MTEPPPDPAPVSLVGSAAPRRVLIADDGKSAAEILAIFFQMEGMETAVAFDGADAVKTAASFEPHLICMDLGMPVMDGYEAARRIREVNKEVVIVAISGWGGESEIKRAMDAGFDFHLLKPVKPNDLREVIARYFGKPQPAVG